ncbi:hypothetical protein BsWGS_01292 [Bradybaena similaris]
MRAGEDEHGTAYTFRTDLMQLESKYTAGMRRSDYSIPQSHAYGTGSARDFTHLRRGGEFSDAIIRVGNVIFPVHRNILACCSPYFRALFTDLDRKRKSMDFSNSNSLETTEMITKAQTKTITVYSDGMEAMDSAPSSTDASWLTKRTPSSSKQSSGQSSPTSDHARNRSPTQCSSSSASLTARKVGSSFSLHRRFGTPSPNGSSESRASSPMAPFTQAFQLTQKPHQAGCPYYEVTLTDVSPETMNDIIEHAYGGKVVVSAHNVEQLLPAADRFQVTSLLKACCDFLSGELSIGNCISIVKFASHFYQCDALREKGTKYLLDNFTSVFQTSPEFEKLTCKELISILEADQLNAKYEELVLDAIIRWVIADVEDRQKHIRDLVRCARVGLMLPDNMREFVDSWLLSGNLNSEFNRVTIQVMESVLQLQKQQMNEVDGAMFSPRLPRDIMFVIGGSNFGFPLNLVEAFDCRTWLWSIICPYDFAPRSYHGMATLENEIYIIGGFSGQVYLSSCCKFKPETLTWHDVTPMNTKRCYVGVAELKGYMYAVGGYDGVYRLNSAERFNKLRNQWSFISPMTHQRSDAGVAVLDDKLYVCGGFNGQECIKAVELYDPDTDRWSPVPGMPLGRSGLGVVAYKNCLYAVGGFDGSDSSVRLSVMEYYSPETRQWTSLQPMPHPRSNLAVEVLEDIMYAIGGYSGDRTTSLVECYDFSTNTWYQSTRLSHNRSALGVCVVSGLPNTADILRRDHTIFRQRLPTLEY